MTDLAMSSVIKKMLTGGYKRRIFVSFDRNHYPTNQADMRDQQALTHRLILAERYIRHVSKSLGFNQIMTSSVSSLDLAEVCLYNSTDQPGMRPVHTLYPSKSFRVYISQFMAGDNLIPFPPALSIPEELLFKNAASLTTSVRARTIAASSTLRRTSQSKLKTINALKDSAYSYGVRLRNMQDDLATQLAMSSSENEFRDQFGDKELAKLQTKVDAKSTTASMPNYMDPRLMPGNKSTEGDDRVQEIVTQQEEVEALIRAVHMK